MYRRKHNTFLTETLLPNKGDSHLSQRYGELKRLIPPQYTNNLTTVSALYIYTKVAETVIRSHDYNRKKVNKEMILGSSPIQRMQWEEIDGKFPHGEVHGNFIPSCIREMTENFLVKHSTHIDSIVDNIVKDCLNTNSDILTKGRQTFCPFTGQSVTAAQAYENAYEFLSSNTDEVGFGVFEWVQSFLSLFDKEKIKYTSTEDVVEEKMKYIRSTKQHVLVQKKVSKRVTKTTENNEETVQVMKQVVCRFASYIKHKERGKKDRRAIASGTPFLRMLLYVVEMFHLELAKQIPGNTISIGGEEKKAKILNNLNNNTLNTGLAAVATQGTEDATKWNECMSPGAFAIMHYYLFDPMTRSRLGLKKISEYGKLFSQISILCNMFQVWKEIQIGPGVLVTNENSFSRIVWRDEDVSKMNTITKEWYLKIRHLITEDRKFIRCSPGMLMGMLNAASTTLGIIPSNYKMINNKMKVICMRSSDDSMTKYSID